jgi:hypothetical protein
MVDLYQELRFCTECKVRDVGRQDDMGRRKPKDQMQIKQHRMISVVCIHSIRPEVKMIRTVLVHLMGTSGDHAVLTTAQAVARPFAAHLECVHIRPDLARIPAGEGVTEEDKDRGPSPR